MNIYRMNASIYKNAGDKVVVMVVEEKNDWNFNIINTNKELIELIISDDSSWDDIAKEIVKIYPNDIDALIYCLQDNLIKKEKK